METQKINLENSPLPTGGYLVLISSAKTPTSARSMTVPLTDFLVVGRAPDCHISLDDTFVSSRHFRIEKKSGTYSLRDLHSRNGTYLNDSRISEATLSFNDLIRVGETTFIFSEKPTTPYDLSSKSERWNEQLKRLPSFASTQFPVLITGPSGSGKEILARAIHENSSRSKGPFVSINCSALSESLIESELFGHVRGSFTGATHDRRGAFESARGGTLFLDEIGDLPLSLQPKLLRALENNEIRPVGSDRAIETDTRIVTATHKNLSTQVRLGAFREDLFFRLNVCQLQPPSLVDRMEDFNDLIYQFAKQYRVRFSFTAIENLKKHSWPGNIRELKNLVARASAYYPGKHIQPEDIDSILDTSTSAAAPLAQPVDLRSTQPGTNGSIIKEIEREMIVRRLIANKGNQRRTAQELGIPKSTLHDRIKTYSIDLERIATGEESVTA